MKKRINPFDNIKPGMPGLPAASAKPVLPGMDLPVWPSLPDDHDDLDDSLDDMSDEDINTLLDEIIVTEKDWTNTHPNMIKCGSDKFYARFANSLQMLLVMECRLPRSTMLPRKRNVVSLSTLLTSSMKPKSVTMHT